MGFSVGLVNTYSTLNIGDAAIYSALTALASEAKVMAKFQDAKPNYIPGLQIVPQIGKCNAYISVGGDIFNNAREGLITKAFIKNLLELRRSPQYTFVFGQSIPRSCHGLSFQALVFCLRRLAAVCVRDSESHQRLIKAGIPAILSFDTAFALSISEQAKEKAKEILQSLFIQPESAALISLRTFDSMYKHDNQQFQQKLVALSRKFCQQGYQPVLVIQSQAYGADNDLAMAEEIVQQVPEIKIFNPFVLTHQLSNWELVMGALAICRLIVAIRYHTSVLALASGRVPFNLYYSNKGKDITKRLQIPGCSLEEFDPEIHFEAIALTSAATFDHEAIRQQVKQDFQQCYSRVLPQ
ncbi:polysaccharide pyruvyl transferase family protein [Cronbergia sp. UHCC 0137]|uniref:polysaccharide pyruvyl transferase family protein n=1 Tax=Cronbergia sp. UHCC 0137 TaxID=3110239 RepID=UPI002B1EC92E|nr:polysaccharide pyruvyl transferase family protein [Cronbergia sp. UHCC 0137]MEA5616609.1 polysaccharide pyruvyl transferase family protein [Cronbergia sp. UHCC 0137]